MLVRKSTLSFVILGAAVFVVGSSFLVWTRPEYTRDIVPSRWIDWTRIKADDSDRPLPISPPPPPDHQPRPGAIPNPPTSPDDDIGVKPLPISTETSQLIPIEVSPEDLVHRLRALLSAPVLSYVDSVKASEKTCPRKASDRQVNPDQLHDQIAKWSSMENDELVRRRIAIVKYLETLHKNGKPLLGSSATGKGRGIVMTGGNKVQSRVAVFYFAYLLTAAFYAGYNVPTSSNAQNSAKRAQVYTSCRGLYVPRRDW